MRGGDSEEGGCRWERTVRRLGDLVTYPSSSSRKVHRALGALGLVELYDGPPGSFDGRPIPREPGFAGARGLHLQLRPP